MIDKPQSLWYNKVTKDKEREEHNMRAVRYEYNGQVYKTLAEAPKGAKVVLVYKDTEPSAKYNAKRVAKIRELAGK